MKLSSWHLQYFWEVSRTIGTREQDKKTIDKHKQVCYCYLTNALVAQLDRASDF